MLRVSTYFWQLLCGCRNDWLSFSQVKIAMHEHIRVETVSDNIVIAAMVRVISRNHLHLREWLQKAKRPSDN